MGSKSSDFYSVKALAEKLGISRSRCYELVKQEDIPFEVLVVGGRILVSKVAYQKFYDMLSELKEMEEE